MASRHSGFTASGQIDFSGTNHGGIRLNSLTTTQRDALIATAGLVIFNSTTNTVQAYNGTSWADVGSGAGGSTAWGGITGTLSSQTDLQTALDAKQGLDATLTGLAAYNTNGLLTQTAADTFTGRTITGTANQITVTNGDGVAGNPTLALPQDIATSSTPTFAAAKLGSLKDSSANTSATLTATASAVNYFDFANAATAGRPTFSVAGSDTNIDMLIKSKGTGSVVFRPGSDGNAAFQLQKAGGSAYFRADSSNSRISVGGTAAPHSTVDVSAGSFAAALVSKTAAYTATATDHTILGDATTAAFNVTLPTAVGITGRIYFVKKTDVSANAVTIATTSSQTIDGTTTKALTTQYAAYQVQSDGANWQIVGKV
jgi:hypothetical protein